MIRDRSELVPGAATGFYLHNSADNINEGIEGCNGDIGSAGQSYIKITLGFATEDFVK